MGSSCGRLDRFPPVFVTQGPSSGIYLYGRWRHQHSGWYSNWGQVSHNLGDDTMRDQLDEGREAHSTVLAYQSLRGAIQNERKDELEVQPETPVAKAFPFATRGTLWAAVCQRMGMTTDFALPPLRWSWPGICLLVALSIPLWLLAVRVNMGGQIGDSPLLTWTSLLVTLVSLPAAFILVSLFLSPIFKTRFPKDCATILELARRVGSHPALSLETRRGSAVEDTRGPAH
jgi:hypothetical protein